MTLENLQKEMIQAMKNKDIARKSVLSSAIGAVKNAAIAKKCKDNISEDLVGEVLLKEQKTLKEQIDTCPDSHAELKAEYAKKYDILSEYCPKLLSDPIEIEYSIKAVCEAAGVELTKANRGNVMKTVMPQFKGKADMKVVNQVIGGLLQ